MSLHYVFGLLNTVIQFGRKGIVPGTTEYFISNLAIDWLNNGGHAFMLTETSFTFFD